MANILATGFETADPTFATWYGYTGGFDGAVYHTGGAMSFKIASAVNNYVVGNVPFMSAASEAWASIWFYVDNGNANAIGFASDNCLTFGSTFYRVSGTSGDTGVAVPYNGWHHLFMHLKVDPTVGIFEFRLDGGALTTYNGNTKPSSYTAVSGIYLYTYNGSTYGAAASMWVDDITVDNAGWPDPLIYKLKRPTANDSVAWTPSTGNNYACVDEVPPADGDYVYSIANADVDLYDCNSLSFNSGDVVKLVSQIVRAKKETPDAGGVKMQVELSGNTDESAEVALTTSYVSTRRLLTQAPGSVPWDTTNINQIHIGQKSVM